MKRALALMPFERQDLLDSEDGLHAKRESSH